MRFLFSVNKQKVPGLVMRALEGKIHRYYPVLVTFLIMLLTNLFSKGNILIPGAILFFSSVVLLSGKRAQRILAHLFYFTLPFTIDVTLPGGSNIGLPGEWFALFFSGSVLYNLRNKKWFVDVLSSPLAICGLLFLMVLFLGLAFTNDLRVSVKYVIVQTIFFLSGGLLTFSLLNAGTMQWREVFTSLALGFAIISIGFLINADFSFNFRSAAPALARPFFKDHTVYSATLCLLTPFGWYAVVTAQSARARYGWITWTAFMCLMILVASSRAAWLSFFMSGLLMTIFLLNIKFRWVFMILILLSMVAYLNNDRLLSFFETNQNDSNRFQSTMKEQALSVANINSDVSNLERLNRWKCALRMFKERPLTGFGPGTYQFNYMPFQLRSEMTRISVQSQFYVIQGRGGTAHSEYLLAMAESGLPGVLSWLVLIITVFFTGIRIIERSKDRHRAILVMCTITALSGYFVHALVNNFLNNANPGILFWILCGLLMSEFSHYQNIGRRLKHKQESSLSNNFND